MPDAPKQDWIKAALQVTGHFEDSADPFGAVTGNFDGMGISLGVLQWNIGSNSLQPLVRKLGRATVVQLMPTYGIDLWTACTSTIASGLSIVRGWQVGNRLRPPVQQELKSFTHSSPFVDQQVAASQAVAKTAFDATKQWASSDPSFGGTPSKALFCWFFDMFTQNGGPKGLTFSDAKAFISANGGITGADHAVCDWLAARSSVDAGFRDSRKNADLWRDSVDAAHLPLLAFSYLRALKSRQEYRGDVLNRKATIAIGKGWVHTERHDLTAILSN